MALGAERKNESDAMDGFGFFGVFWTAGTELSANTGGMRLFKVIGGGAAESKDEAPVNAGLLNEFCWILSSPSRNIAGPVL